MNVLLAASEVVWLLLTKVVPRSFMFLRKCMQNSLPTQILLHGVSTLRRGRKCDFCRQTGVSGRKAIFEASVVDDDVKIAIQEQAPAVQLRRILGAKGEAGLFERAVREAASGVISLEQACKFLDSLFRVPYSAFRNPHFLITPHSWRLCGLA
jgi:hypothetical protein